MSLFVRMSTEILSDAKLMAVGPEAAWMWTKGLAYSKVHLTDGFVPVAALPLLTIGVSDPDAAVQRLVRECLWIVCEGGWTVGVEKWAKHQTTKDQVEKSREGARERKRLSRETSNVSRDGHTVTPSDGHAVTPPPEYRAQSTETEYRATDKKPSARGKREPREVDPRHTEFRQDFDAYFRHKNPSARAAPWDGKEANALARFLASNPELKRDEWQRLLSNRGKSPVAHGRPLSAWVGSALCWLDGIADDFGKAPGAGRNEPQQPQRRIYAEARVH